MTHDPHAHPHADDHGAASTEHHGGGYEKGDLNLAPVLKFLAGLLVLAVVVHFVMAGVMGVFIPRETKVAGDPQRDVENLPMPRQQVVPARDWEIMKAADLDAIQEGGPKWIDKPKGIVSIPIETAMDLIIAKKGLPAREPASRKGPDAK